MSKISLVTSFFNIGRENYDAIPRTDSTYIEHFSFWARIHNYLVVYTDKKTAEIVLEIREGFGLKDKTKIICIDDITTIEPEIYGKMSEINQSHWFRDFRMIPNATSNMPKYSYLMLLKTWFVADAVKNGYVNSRYVAWIDFGFNKGGVKFPYKEDFDFEWQYDFSDKIHLFSIRPIDDKPVFEVVRSLRDYLTGGLYVLPTERADVLWKLTKEAMLNLLYLGLYDDDQALLLLASRRYPEYFDIRQSDWFLAIKDYGGSHMRVQASYRASPIKKVLLDIYSILLHTKKVLRYCLITAKNLLKYD